MKNIFTGKTARQEYIRILEIYSMPKSDTERLQKMGELSEKPFIPLNEKPDVEFDIYLELLEGGYLYNKTKASEIDFKQPAIAFTRMTVKGRLFLQELKEQERKEKWSYKVKKLCLLLVPVICGYILGLLTPHNIKRAIELLSPYFKH